MKGVIFLKHAMQGPWLACRVLRIKITGACPRLHGHDPCDHGSSRRSPSKLQAFVSEAVDGAKMAKVVENILNFLT